MIGGVRNIKEQWLSFFNRSCLLIDSVNAVNIPLSRFLKKKCNINYFAFCESEVFLLRDITLNYSFECSIRVRTAAMEVHKSFGGFPVC